MIYYYEIYLLFSVWNVYPNFCVSSGNEDLVDVIYNKGDSSIEACKAKCMLLSDCSAVEWYQMEPIAGSKCKLITTAVPATQGYIGTYRFYDAECHIKPIGM